MELREWNGPKSDTLEWTLETLKLYNPKATDIDARWLIQDIVKGRYSTLTEKFKVPPDIADFVTRKIKYMELERDV